MSEQRRSEGSHREGGAQTSGDDRSQTGRPAEDVPLRSLLFTVAANERKSGGGSNSSLSSGLAHRIARPVTLVLQLVLLQSFFLSFSFMFLFCLQCTVH